MKVVFVHTDFRIYWSARLNSAREFLNQKGISMEIIEIAGKGSPYSFAKNKNVESQSWHILFPEQEMEVIPPYIANNEVRKKLDEIDPDVVFAGAIAFPSGAAAVKWAVQNKKKVVIFDDARLEDTPRSDLVNYVKKNLYGGVDAILTSSPMMNDTYKYFGFNDNQIFYGVTVVNNSFWKIETGENNISSRGKYFLNVSRQIPKKNLLMLLDSYRGYYKSVSSPIDLVLIGEGPERLTLENFKRENKLDKVHFVPFLSQEELIEYYRSSICYVLPSLYGETWGLTVNEAMASGKPVLVSNQAGCASTLVKNGINGYTFSPSNPEELTELFLKFHYLHEKEIKSMAAKSKEIIRDWDLDRFCLGVYDAINFVLSKSKKRTSIITRFILIVWKGRYRPT